MDSTASAAANGDSEGGISSAYFSEEYTSHSISSFATMTTQIDATSRTPQPSVSTPLTSLETCDTPCNDAETGLNKYGEPDDLCSIFKENADTCLGCLHDNNASDDLVQDWQDRLDPNTRQCQGPGLDTGAIAGGVVGGALGAAVVCTAFFFLHRRRRNRRARLGRARPWKEPGPHQIDCEPDRVELEGSEVPGHLLEWQRQPAVAEMPANEDVKREHELDSTSAARVSGDRSRLQTHPPPLGYAERA